jgi:hypothetical protein
MHSPFPGMDPYVHLYGFNIQDAIPGVPLPLKPDDPELMVDLQTIVSQVYDRGSYDIRINYQQPIPLPALSEADQEWVKTIITRKSAENTLL